MEKLYSLKALVDGKSFQPYNYTTSFNSHPVVFFRIYINYIHSYRDNILFPLNRNIVAHRAATNGVVAIIPTDPAIPCKISTAIISLFSIWIIGYAYT